MDEVSQALDEVLLQQLEGLDIEDEKFPEKSKAFANLYELRIKDKQVQNDYYVKADEVTNRTEEVEIKKEELKLRSEELKLAKEESKRKKAKEIKDSSLVNKIVGSIDLTRLVSIGAMTFGTLYTLKFEEAGHMLRACEFLRSMINHDR